LIVFGLLTILFSAATLASAWQFYAIIKETPVSPPTNAGKQLPRSEINTASDEQPSLDLDDNAKLTFRKNAAIGNLPTVVKQRGNSEAIVEENLFIRADAPVNLPAPTGQLSKLTNIELRKKRDEIVATLRGLHDTRAGWPEARNDALSLASEIAARVSPNQIVVSSDNDPDSFNLRRGRNAIVFGALRGVNATDHAAGYLDFLASKLPAEGR
jgi:hypothetical protein